MGATLYWEYVDWEVEERLQAVGGQSFALRGLHGTYEDQYLPLFGEFAVHNAAAGIVAVESLLGQALDGEALRVGLANVRAPGRLEVVSRNPLLVLDGAHNPAGTEALASAMREFFRWNRLHLVLAVSANKDLKGMLVSLVPLADGAYMARNESVRSADPTPIADAFAAEGKLVEVFDSVAAAIDAARAAAAPEDAVLVTGSLYTVADARRALGLS
jgi:dihydrofolate synthase/folylpolyglutamate synthase